MDISRYRSDIQAKIKEINNLCNKDSISASNNCNELIEYGEAQRDNALIGFGHFTLGEIAYKSNDIATFYYEMSKCKVYFERIREWGYIAASHNMQGRVAFNRGNFPLAMDQYYKAYNLCEENDFLAQKQIVGINLGNIYYEAGYFDEATKYYDEAYKYISGHMNMEDYVEVLAKVLIGKGKVFLKKEKIEDAWAVKNEMEQKCLTFLSDTGKLRYYIFLAMLSQAANDNEGIKSNTDEVIKCCTDKVILMEAFGELYEFLEILIASEKFLEFDSIYNNLLNPIKNSMVKNLQLKLYKLRMEEFNKNGKVEEYNGVSKEYFTVLKEMETESSLVLSAVIGLRAELNNKEEQLKKAKDEIHLERRRALADPLTGLPNRLNLYEYAQIAFERSISNEVGFAIELFDIDYFKEYNDHYGREAGEKCLLKITEAVKQLMEDHSGVSCYRFSGDQFVLLFQSFSEQEVFEMAKALKNEVLSTAVEHELSKEEEKIVTISQGLYWGVPEDGDSVWEYLAGADDLLAKVKEKSRNSIMLGKAKKGKKPEEKRKLEPIITKIEEEKYLPAEN